MGQTTFKHFPGEFVYSFIKHFWTTCAWWLRRGVIIFMRMYERGCLHETLLSCPIKNLGFSFHKADSWTHCGVVIKNDSWNFYLEGSFLHVRSFLGYYIFYMKNDCLSLLWLSLVPWVRKDFNYSDRQSFYWPGYIILGPLEKHTGNLEMPVFDAYIFTSWKSC